MVLQQRPVPAYPGQYRPSALDFPVDLSFEEAGGATRRFPDFQLVAGTRGTWVLHIENRDRDLERGAAITLVRLNCQIAYELQAERPQGRDFCTLESDSEARLRLIPGRSAVNLLSILVESGTFRRGDSCTLRVGDRRQGSVGSEVFWSSTDGQFLLAVDVPGDGAFEGVEGNPFRFRVVAHPEARLLRLLGPTVVATGERFALHLGVFDRNRNVIDGFSGQVMLEAPDGMEGLQPILEFSPEDGGVKILEGVSVRRPGIYRVAVRAAGVADCLLSNPICASEHPDTRVYWGDVHAHGWGDSTMHLMHLRTSKLDPLSRHSQGRRVGRLDFGCAGPMSMDPDKREEVWATYQDACGWTDQPGRYIPFLAYEAHPLDGGDRQVIIKQYRDEPVPPSMRAPIADLDAVYGDRDDVLLEVHIGGAPPRWQAYRPRRERFVEVCSGFGCAEWLLQWALQLGYRPAVCAASDLHLGLMGGPRAVEPFRGRFGYTYPMNQRDSGYGTGPLTAVFAPKLSREDLWCAVEERHTYGTSGARIYLRVTGNGRQAGDEVELGDALEIAITCHACASLDRVDLIAGEYCVQSWHPDALDFEARLTLAGDRVPGEWVYVRAHQVDGEYAWSSPLWVLREGPAPETSGLPRWNADDELDLAEIPQNDAARYLASLERYLELEEHRDRFHQITPVGLLELSVGRCALYYCYWGDERIPMSIRWFYEFDIPKVRYDFGWRDLGAYNEIELAPRLRARYTP